MRKLRRDVDECKRRISDLGNELVEVRKERDIAKMSITYSWYMVKCRQSSVFILQYHRSLRAFKEL